MKNKQQTKTRLKMLQTRGTHLKKILMELNSLFFPESKEN